MEESVISPKYNQVGPNGQIVLVGEASLCRHLPSRLGLSRSGFSAVALGQLSLALDRVLLVRGQVYDGAAN